MEQCKELRHNAFHLVGDKHLVAVELNLVALNVEVRLDAREVEDSGEVERVVHVQMDPEQRFVELHGVERAVEALVVFVFQRAGSLRPERFHIIYNIVFRGVYLLTVLPFGLLSEGYGHGEELAVFLQQLFYLRLLEVFLAVVVDVEDDIRAAVVALGIFDGELRASVAAPLHGLGAFLVAACDDFDLLRHHERRVEAQSEVSDDLVGVVFVLVEEVGDARKGYLVDVLVDFFLGHSDASVADGERALVFVEADVDGQVAQLSLEVALVGECLQLLRGVDGIADHLAQEYFMITVEKFFDDGENVLGRNPDVAFLHKDDMF